MKVKRVIKKNASANKPHQLTFEETKALLEDVEPKVGSEEGEESEEDIDTSGVRNFSKAVLSPSDWTVETIVSQLKQGNIELNPYFQRREAWKPARQSRFIESLFLGIPVPEIVLVEAKLSQGKFVVLDGKQRLLSIVHFSASDVFKVAPLKLESLRFRADLNGKTMEELKSDPTLTSELARFNNRTIRTVVIKNWPSTDYIHLVFERLNTESVKLSPQELRQAMFPGDFIHFAAMRSSQSAWLLKIFGTTVPDFRMRDVELLIRHLAYRYFIEVYAGNLKKFMDTACDTLNKEWDKRKSTIEDDAKHLDSAIETTYAIFGDDAFHKWNSGEGFEQKFNRAIYDVMTYYFAKPKIREAALKERQKTIKAFKSLCETDDFLQSISTTTKSITATQNRLRLWGEKMSVELGIKIQTPVISKKKA